MLSRTRSGALLGIDAYPVDVEVDVARGLPQFSTVGLPEGAVKESKDRIKAAIKNSGYDFPARRVTVNLAPADIRKDGTAFDLPMAIGLLSAMGVIDHNRAKRYVIMGELSLDGRVRPVRGILPVATAARTWDVDGIIVPRENAAEGAIVGFLPVYGAETLAEVVTFLTGEKELTPCDVAREEIFDTRAEPSEDFADVRGQQHVKRALEVAAAGGHNVLMVGPPGSGKTMLARRIPSILPRMTFEESLEATKTHSIVGLLPRRNALLTERPFRNPHHTISDAGLIGGGTYPRPGEVSLADQGVLFLDEMPEFKKNVLEMLRQPLEDGRVTISRAATSLTFPANFMLVAAMNPCPCGYLGDPMHSCSCTPLMLQRYHSRLSGPLLDRIDLHVTVPHVPHRDLADPVDGESSETIRTRVNQGRDLQRRRFEGTGFYANAQMKARQIRQFCKVDTAGESLLEQITDRLGFSARSYARILKVARTIADLEGSPSIERIHLSEAIQYRSLDRRTP